MIPFGPIFEFVVIFLVGCSATWILLFIISKSVPTEFLQANMRGQDDGTSPVRQLGGLAIIPVLIAIILYAGSADGNDLSAGLFALALAIVFAIGILDDRHHLPVLLRLAVQVFAAVIAVIALGWEMRILSDAVPLIAEKTMTVLFLVWFINIANFMDGMDLMTVSGLGIPALFAGIIMMAFSIGGEPLILAAGISGTLAGFAPYNLPKARLYLGDSGSLPLGLAAGVLSLQLAAAGNLLSALLVFGYYHCDAGFTLLRRISNHENIFVSHTNHFYQRAFRAGVSAENIAFAVFVINLILIGAAASTMSWLK